MRRILPILILFLCGLPVSAQGISAVESLRYVKLPPLMREEFTSGVVINGTIGSSGDVFRSDAGLEVQHPTFALISIFNSLNPGVANDPEAAIAFGMRDDAGVTTKVASIRARWTVAAAGSSVGNLGFNATYGTGGQTSLFLTGFGGPNGYGSAYFFGNPAVAPPERRLVVDGDIEVTGQILTANGQLIERGSWTPTLSGFTITGGTATATGIYERHGGVMEVLCTIIPIGGAYITISAGTSIVHGLPISGGPHRARGGYTRADAITDGGVLVNDTDLFMTTTSNPSPAIIVITARYLIP